MLVGSYELVSHGRIRSLCHVLYGICSKSLHFVRSFQKCIKCNGTIQAWDEIASYNAVMSIANESARIDALLCRRGAEDARR